MSDLPFIFPPIETYQGISFILGVMLAYPEYADIRYNNYINLECAETDQLYDMKLMFSDSMWEYYRASGLAEMNLYDVSNLNKNTLCQFICERIDQGCYLLLYDVDEYYLSYTDNFYKQHYDHDTYIYGYSDEYFHILAYMNKHLTTLCVEKQEIVNALYSDKQRSFCTFRPSVNRNVKVDKNAILYKIGLFYEAGSIADCKKGRVYGMDVYDVLLTGMKTIVKEADLRPFRCLWEQKMMMRDRLLFLKDNFNSDCLKQLEKICESTEKVFRLMMKYNLTFNISMVDKAYRIIQSIKKEDLSWYHEHIEKKRRSIN